MKYILLSLLLVGNFLKVTAQDIKGNIKTKQNEPIIQALILSNNGDNHAHTDLLGNFTCKGLKVNDTLTISYLGYKTLIKVVIEEDFNNFQQIYMTQEFYELEQVNITNAFRSSSQIAKIDLAVNPVNSSQDLLQRVPGLIIGQHAGGGKAEQIFLRGFDIDHGTDITIEVDGLPVNMVSHAHGQGYSDLHFMIPETVDKIDFGKGPYYGDKGNFNTAGYVNFKTKDKIDKSVIGVEVGRFNSSRLFSMVDLIGDNDYTSAYLASEFILTDGPFESPQNFNRFNFMGKFLTRSKTDDRLSIMLSRFQSKWDASGQIPDRLVRNGTINRFGSVDDTEGGFTDRTNALIDYTKILTPHRFIKSKAFFSNYNFELYSNFTFFLEDPVNGDQIRQKENRNIYGIQSQLLQTIESDKVDTELTFGLGMRYDDVNNNELTWTINRVIDREAIILGDIDETNLYAFGEAEFNWGKWLLNAAVRFDRFDFNYNNRLSVPYNPLQQSKNVVSPKLNIIYNPNRKIKLYLKTGIGFHSNDSRVVLEQGVQDILPLAIGSDLGVSWKPQPRLWVNAALWFLNLQQEFVYVGDAGIVEPSGKSKRMGVEVETRFQLNDYVYFDTDVTYTHARAVGAPEGENRIPLAPSLTASGGFSFNNYDSFSGGIRYKFIKDRPANESNAIIALGYFIVDANVNYNIGNIGFGLNVENLLNSEWNQAQFATLTRLRNESEPVEELHYTPGVPINIRGSLRYSF